jgi:GH25 family lysozyme M1 (1,4-beta-N-acetylmuramidase)
MAQRPLGIDVSHYQGAIAWSSVRSSGITFGWAKATEGTTFADSYFTANESGANAASVYLGAYHFARYDLHTGTAGADAEAAWFWSVAGAYIQNGHGYLMPMLDVEAATSGYTKTTLSQWVDEWCHDIVNDAKNQGVSVKPVIYASSSFAGTWFDSTVTQWTPWIANWNGQNPQTGSPSPYSPWSTWTAWQYSDATTVPGISGSVDGDVFNGIASGLVSTLVIPEPGGLWLVIGGSLMWLKGRRKPRSPLVKAQRFYRR